MNLMSQTCEAKFSNNVLACSFMISIEQKYDIFCSIQTFVFGDCKDVSMLHCVVCGKKCFMLHKASNTNLGHFWFLVQ